MSLAEWLRELVRHLAGFAAAVLPERVKRWEWLAGLPTGRLHVLSGAAEALMGVSLFLTWMLAYVSRFTAEYGYTFLASRPSLSHGVIGSMGVLGYVSFLFTVRAWFALYLVLEGIVRVLEVVMMDRRPGMMLLVWADWLRRQAFLMIGRARLHRALGPTRSDRLERSGEPESGELTVWSVHEHPWRQGQVVRFAEDGLFVLCEAGLAQDGRYQARKFRFRPLDPGEVIRGEVGVYPTVSQGRPGKEHSR